MFKRTSQNVCILLISMLFYLLPTLAQANEIGYNDTQMTIKPGATITATYTFGAPDISTGSVRFTNISKGAKLTINWGGVSCWGGAPCGVPLPPEVIPGAEGVWGQDGWSMGFTLGSAPPYVIQFTNITDKDISLVARKFNNYP